MEDLKKTAKRTIVMIIFMAIAKLSTFIRDIILTSMYGASAVSDSYLISVAIPTILCGGLMIAIYTCYIPVYKEIKLKDNKEAINEYNSSIVFATVIISAVIVLAFFLFDDFFLKIIAAGFDETSLSMTKSLSKMMMLSVVFMGLEHVLQGYLQSNDRFYLVAARPIPINIISIVGILLSIRFGYYHMALSVVIGHMFCILYFGLPAYKSGFRLSKSINFKSKYIIKTVQMILPVFIGQIIVEINSIIDKSVASFLPAGDVTVLDYAFKVMAISYSCIVNPIATLLYPKISDDVIEGNEKSLIDKISDSIGIVSFVMMPICIIMMVAAKPIVEVLFYHGAFSMESVMHTTEALQLYCIAIVPISVRMIVEKVFYARKETKTPMINSAIGIAINIILNLILVKFLAHKGLALATSVASTATSVLLFINLKRKYKNINYLMITARIFKYLVVSLASAGVLLVVNRLISGMNLYALLIIDGIVGFLVYYIILVLIKDPIAFEINNIIIHKVKENKNV